MKKLDNKNFYNQDALDYDKRWNTDGGLRTDRIQRLVVSDMCSNWASKEVVEIGSGTGRFSIELAKIGAQLTLVDVSQNMLRIAENKLKSAGLEHNLKNCVNSSIYDLPFESNSFEKVITLNVFNHLENPSLALQECSRILKKEGEILLNYPNFFSYFWPAAVGINWRSKAVGQNVYSKWMKPKEMRQQMLAVGLVIQEQVGHVHIPRALTHKRLKPLLSAMHRLDSISRHKPLQSFAPVHYCLCRKM